MGFRKSGNVKQLANRSVNHSAATLAIIIPTIWILVANLLQFLINGGEWLRVHRLVALAIVILWGGIVAWVLNVPQVLYLYRPGGKNKAQRRLFILSVLGLLISLSALVILGLVQMSSVVEGPLLTFVVAPIVILGLLPIAIGCAKPWRYIYLTDPRGVYVAYTGQVLQPNTRYRTGLTWKTSALEHFLETEEDKIHPIKFKDGTFELRYSATVSFPETPVAPEKCIIDPRELSKASSDFLLRHLQAHCLKHTGMQCMKMEPGFKPVEESVDVPARTPKGYMIPIRMRWSGKFKLSDTR
jgi:hypothetical protein